MPYRISIVANAYRLDPEDAKVDDKVTRILDQEVRLAIYNAREKMKTLLEDARKSGNQASSKNSGLKHKLEKRDQVLVRIRVEHSGFTTLSNQRFGARFVGDVANPVSFVVCIL